MDTSKFRFLFLKSRLHGPNALYHNVYAFDFSTWRHFGPSNRIGILNCYYFFFTYVQFGGSQFVEAISQEVGYPQKS